MNLKTRYRSRSKKRVIRFFVFYSFLALFLILNSTAGRYTFVMAGTPRVDIAKWEVKINNNDIISQTTLTDLFDLIPNMSNENTTDNKLAPGQKGYFDIVINPENTEVSVEYNIVFDTSKAPAGVQVTSYEVIGQGKKTYTSSTGIVDTIELNENLEPLKSTDAKTVRVYWEWSSATSKIPTGTESYNISATISVKQKI